MRDRPAADYNATDAATRDYHDLPLASARAGGGVAVVNRAQEVQANLHQTRHARRGYVCGFPPGTTEQQLISFFNAAVATAFGEHATDFGGPVFTSNIFSNTSKNFCFIGARAPALWASGGGPARARRATLSVRTPVRPGSSARRDTRTRTRTPLHTVCTHNRHLPHTHTHRTHAGLPIPHSRAARPHHTRAAPPAEASSALADA